jgi:CheY-like chemotaxis protein
VAERNSVLVVDDDVVILRLVREALTGLLDCDVETTPSPERAFELILQRPWDLLIFDYQMPTIDGATLYLLVAKVFAVKKLDLGKLPPLLLMSGHAGHRRAQDLLREPGVRGLIAKPFSIERLIERVSSALA